MLNTSSTHLHIYNQQIINVTLQKNRLILIIVGVCKALTSTDFG